MKRDIFRRGVRMQHQFGVLEERNDPLGTGTFSLPHPTRVTEHRTGPVTIQQHGEHRPFPARSAIVKPNGGTATLAGPEPDYAMNFAVPTPVGTKRRKEHI